ncbi:hypothetical protein BCR32DRAFT_294593 [Anaeromyces robustus]|uniref:Uncharacterized protein n=1 Tax=Anaeromyces robustus TaxID=1754192 RepID=A0A1Y1X0K0_9FUNG|nr:hypothetical protein BCR32DRAFT_294593 [Anaeromyces robustus]|eukprot:ORX79138.1 hypothetical protein BCR32DRAFT_294593 [Anaeromyces robustus]
MKMKKKSFTFTGFKSMIFIIMNSWNLPKNQKKFLGLVLKIISLYLLVISYLVVVPPSDLVVYPSFPRHIYNFFKLE